MPARAPGSHGDVAFRCFLFSFQEKKNRIIEWLLERHSHIQIYDNIYLLSERLKERVYLQQNKKKAKAESKNCHAKTMLSLKKPIKLI